MGGWVEGLACADPETRTPIGASGNSALALTKLNNRTLACKTGPLMMFSQIAGWLLTYEHRCRNVDVISLITNCIFHINLEYYIQEFIMKLFTGWQWAKMVEKLASPILDVKSRWNVLLYTHGYKQLRGLHISVSHFGRYSSNQSVQQICYSNISPNLHPASCSIFCFRRIPQKYKGSSKFIKDKYDMCDFKCF